MLSALFLTPHPPEHLPTSRCSLSSSAGSSSCSQLINIGMSLSLVSFQGSYLVLWALSPLYAIYNLAFTPCSTPVPHVPHDLWSPHPPFPLLPAVSVNSTAICLVPQVLEGATLPFPVLPHWPRDFISKSCQFSSEMYPKSARSS